MTINSPLIGSHPITQGFGGNAAAYKRFGLLGHNGVDYGTPINTPIYAIDHGVVDKRGFDPSGYGNYIKLKHAWGYSLYAHLESILVLDGADVKSGMVIGRTGNTGNSTGPHLHFEIRPFDEPTNNGYNGAVDPTTYMPPSDIERVMRVLKTANLRSSPAISDNRIGVIYEGTPVDITSYGNEWLAVTISGYIHRDLVG